MKKFLFLIPAIVIIIISLLFFKSLAFGKIPIPSDTIVGLYHPFRDLYAKEYPRGIPFKNFLITDPVRQQYPWRYISINLLKKLELPLWNPYSFGGYPLLGNIQSAPFYPLNILFGIAPFVHGWSLLVMLQPLLSGLFLYLYLDHLRINRLASFLGSLAFSFSGFSIAWMEWNTILHVGLWLPLILLSIDKIFANFKEISNSKYRITAWSLLFIFSLTSSFFAGHLQTFFYLFLITVTYFITRWFQYGKSFNILFAFLLFAILFLLFTSIQWIPTLQFILHSSRDIDQIGWQQEGWFIPWQHLVMFIAPDFFGNPTTLNYWGVWNYAEFIGYISIFSLIIAFFALFFRRDKKTLFFGTLFFLSLIFSLPTILAKLPFILGIPFLSTAQPTRLLFITDFSLAILSALGLDYFLRNKKKIEYPIVFLFLFLAGLWMFVLFGNTIIKTISAENIMVAKRNLIFPTGIFVGISALLLFLRILPNFNRQYTKVIYIIILGVTIFDFLRFGQKFTPFADKEYLFPQTKILSFLQKNQDYYRLMTTDSRILPPNFSGMYKLQSVDGYDPLYLRRYGELIAASQRGEANISPPFGFNRIITPHNYNSKIIDLLGVKYVLSLTDISSTKLEKVFQEGQTRVYENKNVLPRVFFVERVGRMFLKERVIERMFANDFDPRREATIENPMIANYKEKKIGKADMFKYSDNYVVINTENEGDGFLVLTDTFYPTWRATVDGDKVEIYRTDYNFRGIFVPKGKHTVTFFNTLF